MNWFLNVFSPTKRYQIHIMFGTQEAIEAKLDNQNSQPVSEISFLNIQMNYFLHGRKSNMESILHLHILQHIFIHRCL